MNAKPGDLCLLLPGEYRQLDVFVGQIHRVSHRSTQYENSWLFEPPLMYGKRLVSWQDRDLRPIRDPGDDARDEMLRPLPEEVTA